MPSTPDAPLFARSKLRPPRVHTDILLRERLSSIVTKGLARARLVLVSAPAGSGKTTLLVSTLAATPAVAWLALDTHDNDLVRFLRALVASLVQVLPDTAPSLAAALDVNRFNQNDMLAWGRHVVTVLVNVLPDDASLVIALDDVHTISEPLIFTLLDELIAQLPPGVVLLIATRYDPPLALARLRARRQLVEVRLPDLRFRIEETTALLNEQLQLQLDAAAIARLHAQTDGWITGLHLLADALDRITTPNERARFIDQLHGLDRDVFDYLADEVLDRQDPFVRMFLLETAVLSELTPARCEALTGRDDAAVILDTLYRRNLFLVLLDADDGRPSSVVAVTYRYHDLFRTFLLARLERDHPLWLVALHRRAAASEPDRARRIAHLLAAQAWDEAAAAIEQAAPSLAAQGAYPLLRSWIVALPTEVGNARPWLVYWLGMDTLQAFDLATARGVFQRALIGFTAAGDTEGETAALLRLAMIEMRSGDWTTASRATEHVLARPLLPVQRIELTATRATEQLLTYGRWRDSLTDLDTMLDVVEAAQSARLAGMMAATISGVFATLPGGLARIERLEQSMEQLAGDAYDRLALLEVRSRVQSWRGRWHDGAATFDELCHLSEQLGLLNWAILRCGCYAGYRATLRGDRAAMEAVFADALARLAATPAGYFLAVLYLCWRARARWLFGDSAGVRADYQRIVALEATNAAHPYNVAVQPLTQAVLALAEHRYAAAETALTELLAIQERLRYTTLLSDGRVLLAHLHLERSDPDAALAAFAPALADARAADAPGYLLWEGHVIEPLLHLARARNVHADFAQHTLALLHTFAAPADASETTPAARTPVPSSPQLPSGEILTAREIEVVRALATGASNTEIAAQLVMSPHTAKRHVSNILAKLQATTRTEAAMRARALGLLT